MNAYRRSPPGGHQFFKCMLPPQPSKVDPTAPRPPDSFRIDHLQKTRPDYPIKAHQLSQHVLQASEQNDVARPGGAVEELQRPFPRSDLNHLSYIPHGTIQLSTYF